MYYENAVICLYNYWISRASIDSNLDENTTSAYQQAAEACRATCLEVVRRIIQLLEIWPNQSSSATLSAMVGIYACNVREYIAATLAGHPGSADETEMLGILQKLDKLIPRYESVVILPSSPSCGDVAVPRGVKTSFPQQPTLPGTGYGQWRPETNLYSSARQDRSVLATSAPVASTKLSSTARHGQPTPGALDLDTQQHKSTLQNLGNAGLFNQIDANYDPFFLPQERQLLGLPSKSPISPESMDQMTRSV
jgi:hypothetical protein